MAFVGEQRSTKIKANASKHTFALQLSIVSNSCLSLESKKSMPTIHVN